MSEAYAIVLFVHVFAAVALVGHSLSTPVIRNVIREADSLHDLRHWLAFAARAGRLNPVAAVILLATGIYLGSYGWWGQPWFLVSIAAWLVNAALAGAVLKPSYKAVMSAAAKAGEGPVTAEVDELRQSRRLAVSEQAMLASDVVILFVMFNKPGLIVCLAAMALVSVVLIVPAVVRRRAPAPKAELAGA